MQFASLYLCSQANDLSKFVFFIILTALGSYAQILIPSIVLARLPDTEVRIGCFPFTRIPKNSEIWNIRLQCGKMATVIQNPLKS